MIGFAAAGSTVTFTNDTYLVPPAKMQKILRIGAVKEKDLREAGKLP